MARSTYGTARWTRSRSPSPWPKRTGPRGRAPRGVSLGLDRFDVSAGEPPALIEARWDGAAPGEATSWSLHSLRTDAGHAAAVAVRRPRVEVIVRAAAPLPTVPVRYRIHRGQTVLLRTRIAAVHRLSPLRPVLPRRPGDRVRWEGLKGSSRSLAISAAAREFPGLTLVVAPDAAAADALRTEIAFFSAATSHPGGVPGHPLDPAGAASPSTGGRPAPPVPAGAQEPPTPLLHLPDWETLPYDALSPHQDIVSERLATLYALPGVRRGILVATAATLLGRIAPRGFVEGNSLLLSVGDRLDLDATRRRFEVGGYRCVSQVMEHGEFAVRGSLLDLFPTGAARPYRIDLFDAEVDTIRTFDPESQRSLDRTDSVRLLPAREFPLDEAAIGRFRAAWRTRFEGNPNACPVYRDVSGGFAPAGIEYWLPLFFDRTGTLFDYLPGSVLVVELPRARDQASAFWEDTGERYEQRRHDAERPVPPPGDLFLSPDALAGELAAYPRVVVRADPADAGTDRDAASDRDPGAPPPPADATALGAPRTTDQSLARGRFEFATAAAPALPADARAPDPFSLFKQFRERFAGRILLLVESPGRHETLVETLRRHGLDPRRAADWTGFLHDPDETRFGIVLSQVESGVILDDPAIALLPEALLFGRRTSSRRRRARGRDAESVIRDLAELQTGDPVVHEHYGVGRYRGLVTLTAAGVTGEYLNIEYADRDQLYVPVLSLHLVSRYAGAENAPLHKLGSQQWQRARKAAAERVRDVAAELLEIQARREARTGNVIAFDTGQYAAFAEGFPFEETPDQAAAIEATLADLRSERPMDRLVCGDVGFGKTEVAMRAAFSAAMEGWQVAILVPTTLLAQQHFQTFIDRFADWPVRIEQLSRFRSRRHREEITRDLARGRIEVVIGTHRLLQDDVRFKRLGLVIVDEEHRFGVRQKERLKTLRAEVDVLTLTATPIPRTLNMALSSLRDLSLIGTAPERRLSIRTFVGQWRPEIIRESILREIRRGGQVYFVHNRVEDIEEIADKVEAIVPEAEIRVAHGQMRERNLEEVMLDFYHRRFNVLVCTTIIESGIDVPTANTILINRADRFGLAQLHQLRGRVGRSHQRAYAYLFAPDRRSMTPDAAKRMDAIESLDDLGIGFSLAMHDLEIRGAGEILGADQSGQIEAIGYSLYTEMLARAVADLRAGRDPAFDRPLDHGTEVELHVPALIPEDYLPDVHARLILYKRIAGAGSEDDLRELEVEMIDRFGPLPAAAKTLLLVTARKLDAAPLGIRKIDLGSGGGRLTFGEDSEVDPARVVALLQSHPRRFRLDGDRRIRIRWDLPDLASRLAAIDHVVAELGAPREAA